MTAKWGEFGGEGIEQKGERTHRHGQQWGDFGDMEVLEDWMVMEKNK